MSGTGALPPLPPPSHEGTGPGADPTRPGDASVPGPGPGWASVSAVAGLAREVDGLRRAVDAVIAVAARVDDLAALLARLAEEVAARPVRPAPPGPVTWLVLTGPEDAPEEAPQQAVELLDGLAGWLGEVYLRYPDARPGLVACWWWHPDVVEELLVLMQAWTAAYQGPAASVSAAADWDDRLRPHTVQRIGAAVGSCSLERHPATPAVPVVPLAHAAGRIAGWWATGRDHPAPAPTVEDHAAADAAAAADRDADRTRHTRTRDPRDAGATRDPRVLRGAR